MVTAVQFLPKEYPVVLEGAYRSVDVFNRCSIWVDEQGPYILAGKNDVRCNPTDWVVNTSAGDEVCKSKEFEQTYTLVNEEYGNIEFDVNAAIARWEHQVTKEEADFNNRPPKQPFMKKVGETPINVQVCDKVVAGMSAHATRV